MPQPQLALVVGVRLEVGTPVSRQRYVVVLYRIGHEVEQVVAAVHVNATRYNACVQGPTFGRT
ncbi:hypothetical protein OG203_44430 [Nocardia sp. NBC_01499]|uniref:hypothetical protein n=1 Tax=Nocardia sp. NBC_01499 TaxID=2903597 RepID=UPI003867B936